MDVEAYRPMVTAIARRIAAAASYQREMSDLIQDGFVGLLSAADRFEPDHGCLFETFAESRVRGAMLDALRRDAWPRQFRKQLRAVPDHDRDAIIYAFTLKVAGACLRLVTTPEESCRARLDHDRIEAALWTLSPRERLVVQLYYYEDMKMKDIGVELGVNESRISQLHARALRKLRTRLERN